MIVFRRRLIYWIIKEYVKKWRKTILLCFLLGVITFFLLHFFSSVLTIKVPFSQKETIGISGAYTFETLPPTIVNNLSEGLTTIDANGKVLPGAASSWSIEESGKKYVFTLKKNVYFTDGKNFTSNDVNYNFSDVTLDKPSKYTVIFTLKQNYAPFLITVSKPIFKQGSIGLLDYKIKNVKVNGSFIQSLTVVSTKNSLDIKTYQFYPTVDALKSAYLLGEVTRVDGLSDTKVKNGSFESFKNTNVTKNTNYTKLVTLFYNITDPRMSDDKLRSALSYALPDAFSLGERAYISYPPTSWAYDNALSFHKYDMVHAQDLLKASSTESSGSAKILLQLKTLPKYTKTAQEIATAWKPLGIEVKIEVVNTLPSNFQIFLGDFTVPKDPDQYTIWHSHQENNITGYKNLRIDKLLEDGRNIVGADERKKIYSDFQKYLLADSPASFLYFPYEYSLLRK